MKTIKAKWGDSEVELAQNQFYPWQYSFAAGGVVFTVCSTVGEASVSIPTTNIPACMADTQEDAIQLALDSLRAKLEGILA